jgi:hypothetical protein
MLALITWSLIMWLWMYATRLPAMAKAGIDPQDAAIPGALDVLPVKARQVANNYNHLHEQPTIFYALVVYCHLAGTVDALMIQLAWGYVAARFLHSITQATFNRVTVRFTLFVLSNVALFWIAIRNLMAAM